jgi:hypothetical protein
MMTLTTNTKRIPMKGGDEYDGLTKARKFLLWKAVVS